MTFGKFLTAIHSLIPKSWQTYTWNQSAEQVLIHWLQAQKFPRRYRFRIREFNHHLESRLEKKDE